MYAKPARASAVLVVAILAAGLASTTDTLAHKTHAKHLRIVHPHCTEPAAGVGDVNVAMTIHNEGRETERLVSAASPAAGEAALVGTGAGGGIEIPPGASLKLTASGPHVRLSGLKKPPVSYEMLPLSLTFARAGRVNVEVMVEEGADGIGAPAGAKPAPGAPAHRH